MPPRPGRRACPNVRVIALHAFRQRADSGHHRVIGLQVGVLFTGAIPDRDIFSWPGVASVLIEAIKNRRIIRVLQAALLIARCHS